MLIYSTPFKDVTCVVYRPQPEGGCAPMTLQMSSITTRAWMLNPLIPMPTQTRRNKQQTNHEV